MQIENKEDGTLVQQFIWDKVCVGCGYFEGVKHLSKIDLYTLKALITEELSKEDYNE